MYTIPFVETCYKFSLNINFQEPKSWADFLHSSLWYNNKAGEVAI